MKIMKRGLLLMVALALALTAAPAAAARGRDEGFRGGHREERRAHEERELPRHERWEHGGLGFVFPAPYAAPYCYSQDGYWAWDGWQYVWVPPQTVCQ